MPGSYSDRHLEMADELRDWLADGLPPAVTITRSYVVDEAVKETPVGKRVRVYPTSEEDVQRLSRVRIMTEYGFAVIVAETYKAAAESGAAETVPDDWTDERCGWVRLNVYVPLNDAVRKHERLIATAFPQTCRIEVKFDPERLLAKEFWSRVDVSFREEREG